ncbi:MAG: phosphoribosylanthranilate isomerase [Gemmatimonadota bacterium]|nr:phosphoribosylanthranilate isomerase [Gemmatimonadota bacterium]
MMRGDDVRVAVELGAAYIGAIFAGGPRLITVDHARRMFDGVDDVRRVGVFGAQSADEIARTAEAADLDVIQLHADPTPMFVAEVKGKTGLETWAAIRVANMVADSHLRALSSCADAILFDARSDGALGGTGRTFDWTLLPDRRRAATRIVLAGGLTPVVVGDAIARVRPDVVDVSSGVESAPGVKDPQLMRAFVDAVRAAT